MRGRGKKVEKNHGMAGEPPTKSSTDSGPYALFPRSSGLPTLSSAGDTGGLCVEEKRSNSGEPRQSRAWEVPHGRPRLRVGQGSVEFKLSPPNPSQRGVEPALGWPQAPSAFGWRKLLNLSLEIRIWSPHS